MSARGCKLFVGNLSLFATNDKLRSLFQEYGEVVEATIASKILFCTLMEMIVLVHANGDKKRFAFVTMKTPEQATECAEKLNGFELEERKMRVDICGQVDRHTSVRSTSGGDCNLISSLRRDILDSEGLKGGDGSCDRDEFGRDLYQIDRKGHSDRESHHDRDLDLDHRDRIDHERKSDLRDREKNKENIQDSHKRKRERTRSRSRDRSKGEVGFMVASLAYEVQELASYCRDSHESIRHSLRDLDKRLTYIEGKVSRRDSKRD